jgi:hypothetical protein
MGTDRSVDLAGPAPRRWPRWAIVFLVVQVLVPAWQLTQPPPARFGWQMYAAAARARAFAAVHSDGSVTPIVLDEYIIRRRDDLDLRRFLPPAICARTGAVAVRYRDSAGGRPVEIPCRP